jgi:hypothetical protein
MPERKTTPPCNASGGLSEPDSDGDRHTHTCSEDLGHGGRHSCFFCPHTW